MSTVTFYVDGHNGIQDTQNVWANDANAFNGDATSAASTTVSGNVTSNAITGLGTNASATLYTGTIVQVRTRIFAKPASSGAYVFGYVTGETSYATGGVSPFVTGTTTATWSSWFNMNNPSGGWTWQKIRDIKGTAYSNSTGTAEIYKIEIEVMFNAPKAATFVHSFPGTSLDTSVWETFVFGTGSISVADKVTLGFNGGSTNAARITAKKAYDLSGSSLYFKADVNAMGVGGLFTMISGSNPLYLNISGTSVSAWAGGAARITYNFTDQALYFKVREASGVFYLDTSVDNVTYTNRGSFTLATYGLDLSTQVIIPSFQV